MQKLITYTTLILCTLILSCKKRSDDSPAAADPTPAPTPTVSTPIPTVATPATTTPPVTTPTASTPAVSTPAVTTPTPNTVVPSGAVVATVPLNQAGTPIIPSNPIVSAPYIITTTGQVISVAPADLNCRNINVSAYYVPCSSFNLCFNKCGYYVCEQW